MKRALLTIFAVAAMVHFYNEQSHAQMPDSCLYVQPDSIAPDWMHTNPDSVARDTCSASSTYRKWYSKRYDVYFKVNAFNLGYGAPDSVMIVYWQDIDTLYTALRDSFESIYEIWGPFYFQKVNPEDTVYGLVAFKMIFDEYILANDGVLDALNAIWTDGLVEIGFRTPLNPPNDVFSSKSSEFTWNLWNKTLYLKMPDAFIGQQIKVHLFDLLGREVFHSNVSTNSNGDIVIDFRGVKSGIYFCFIEKTRYSIPLTLQ